MRLCAGVAAPGIVLVQKPDLSALFILHAFLMQVLVHPLRAPSIIFREFRYRQQAGAVQDHIVIACLRPHLRKLLLLHGGLLFQRHSLQPLGLKRLQRFDQSVRVVHNVIQRKYSVLPDRRKDFRCHPPLEAFRGRKPAGKDQAVKTGFVDKHRRLLSSHRVANRYPIHSVLFINMLRQSIPGIGVAKNLSYILTNKIRLTIDCDTADRAELRIAEYL